MLRAFVLTFVLSLVAIPTAHAQEWASAELDKSPRHLEYVKVRSGTRDVNCFVAYPEVKEKAPAVLVIHEIFGLTDWVRLVADQLAAAGYIAIAPDLLSGAGPDGGGTTSFKSSDATRQAISSLNPEQVTSDLTVVGRYVRSLPAANGALSACGFCWGGGQVFRLATNNKDIQAAFVFYGSGPDSSAEIARIQCPVYGFYGGNDARVNATIPRSRELMAAAGKTYDPVIYDGAGHGFMRAGDPANPEATPANTEGRNEAWKRWKELLAGIKPR
ncbi:MAG: dienelactone hydrolase family protein [Pirellulales bacterium]|nr:dienelactone hydrolase family protein [Pirellulales bacterium]